MNHGWLLTGHTFSIFFFNLFDSTSSSSSSSSSCLARNLSITADNEFRLYFDGAEWTHLPSAKRYDSFDSVQLPPRTEVLAIHALNREGGAGILASTTDGYVLTNSSWSCSSVYSAGWASPDYDDSLWPNAVQLSRGVTGYPVNLKASWIWLAQTAENKGRNLTEIYCRKRLLGASCSVAGAFSPSPPCSWCRSQTSIVIAIGVFLGLCLLAILTLSCIICRLRSCQPKRRITDQAATRRNEDRDTTNTNYEIDIEPERSPAVGNSNTGTGQHWARHQTPQIRLEHRQTPPPPPATRTKQTNPIHRPPETPTYLQLLHDRSSYTYEELDGPLHAA